MTTKEISPTESWTPPSDRALQRAHAFSCQSRFPERCNCTASNAIEGTMLPNHLVCRRHRERSSYHVMPNQPTNQPGSTNTTSITPSSPACACNKNPGSPGSRGPRFSDVLKVIVRYNFDDKVLGQRLFQVFYRWRDFFLQLPLQSYHLIITYCYIITERAKENGTIALILCLLALRSCPEQTMRDKHMDPQKSKGRQKHNKNWTLAKSDKKTSNRGSISVTSGH